MTDETKSLPHDPETLLTVTLDLARHLIECGADIHRAEDTASRICTAYGAAKVDVFCLTSFISATVTMPDGSHVSQTRRIHAVGIDLYHIEKLNALSRRICSSPIPPDEIPPLLEQAMASQPYPLNMQYLGAVLAAGGYAVYFGGNLIDGISAAVVALILTFLLIHRPSGMNPLAATVLQAAFTGILAVLFVWAGFGVHADMVLVGDIMLMTPGLTLGSALRDLLSGDTISGHLRLMSALLCAAAIAAGIAISLTVVGGLL